ncbi:hypothetical protein [Streptomyces sp. NBC_00162]|uniref:hypothetical protein n=1 Tax=Streptomyces sp. NBC_00162 TaxID=2903629 RepID=UPI00214BC9CC|nr:hypothetical protein [Streptomyces sp. NBC_00162]UUU37619.1 hypothetical protein JIW86_00980 [Streptomyces sp. NBC_00162]
MSYDLAVWEGEQPTDDRSAGRVLTNLYDRYLDTEMEHAPTERIAAYVAALLERWCDITEDVEESSPWAACPLIGEGRGPLIYFAMRWDMAEEASSYAAALAASMGLVCFDPQQNRLRL